MPLTIGLSILVSGAFGMVQVAPPPAAVHHAAAPAHPGAKAAIASATMASPADPDVKASVEKYFADIPIMIAIAGCESNYHQYDVDGNILTSVTDDLGVMQINAYTHASEASALGYDLSTVDGNMGFARWLYEHAGTAPWLSSSGCWSGGRTIASTLDSK